IAEVNTQFTIAARMNGLVFDGWLNELTLKRRGMIDRFDIVREKDIKQTVSLIPDATFVITADRPYRFLLEVDKGTETLKDIEMKMVKYRQYLQSSEGNGPSIY